MLFGKNMLDMKRAPKGSLRDKTVFAATLRSTPNSRRQLCHELRCKAWRAFSCQ